jgi:hypothetical protein
MSGTVTERTVTIIDNREHNIGHYNAVLPPTEELDALL